MKSRASVRMFTVVLGLATTARAQVPLQSPASVSWHEPTRAWFVSNSGRLPGTDEPGGWVARLDAGDRRSEPYWIKGLSSPRGMATLGDRLYVADATSVVVIDIGKRAVERRLRMPGARLLHGIAADPGGDLYVSDFLRNAIYRVARGEVPEVFIASRRLESPTALAIQGPHLIVATWGVITDPSTLTTRTPGRLLRVKLGSKDISPIADRPLGHLDGLQVSDGAYLVSDRLAGKLLRISPEGTVTLVRGGLRGPAGLGLNPQRGIVAVPEREANNVVFLSLK